MSQLQQTDVSYDKYGRMKYHPDIHTNQKKPWSNSDQKYLIENYENLGPEQISFDLGRTIHTVMTRAYELRKQGTMPKRSANAKAHKRMQNSRY
jgi:hypothetical protein